MDKYCSVCGAIVTGELEFKGKTICGNCFKVHTFECPECGEREYRNRSTNIEILRNGERTAKRICNDCISKLKRCDCCGAYSKPEDFKYVSGSSICPSCYETKVVKCHDCGEEIIIDYAHHYGDEHLCSACYENNYTQCARCGDTVHCEDTIETADGYVCDFCAEDYVECSDCGRLVYNSQTETVGEEIQCSSCFNNHHFRCYNCDDVFEIDNAMQDREGRLHCEACAREKGLNGTYVIKRYEQKDSTYKEMPYKYTYGVELETSNMPSRMFAGVFSQVNDGSITGKEYVSPILYGDYGLEVIREFCTSAVRAGLQVDKKCGYHLHVGAQELKWDKIVNIAKLYYFMEPLIYHMNPEQRRGTTTDHSCGKPAPVSYDYIKANSDVDLRRKYYGFSSDIGDGRIREYSDSKYQPQRYRGVNLHSLWHRGTIEFRYMSGTLNSDKVINWLKIHILLIEYGAKENIETFVAKIEKEKAKIRSTADLIKLLFNSFKELVEWSSYKDKKKIIEFVKERVEKFNKDIRFSDKKRTISPVDIKNRPETVAVEVTF